MNTLTVNQTAYETLVEERLAFQDAGMTAKVVEWDYKIKLAEAAMQYQPTSFEAIIGDLGINGLNDVLAKRKAHFAAQKHAAQDLARRVLGRLIDAKTVSESQLWSLLSNSNYRFAGNPMAKVEAIKMMLPKLRGTARNLLELSLKEQVIPDEDLPEMTAYVKIVTLENYTADDNPPMQVMRQIAEARKSGLFSCMVIAYPMVGPVKKIDPIVIGLIQDPNKEYPALGSIDRLWLNGDAPIDYMRSLDWGSMFKITEWV